MTLSSWFSFGPEPWDFPQETIKQGNCQLEHNKFHDLLLSALTMGTTLFVMNQAPSTPLWAAPNCTPAALVRSFLGFSLIVSESERKTNREDRHSWRVVHLCAFISTTKTGLRQGTKPLYETPPQGMTFFVILFLGVNEEVSHTVNVFCPNNNSLWVPLATFPYGSTEVRTPSNFSKEQCFPFCFKANFCKSERILTF